MSKWQPPPQCTLQFSLPSSKMTIGNAPFCRPCLQQNIRSHNVQQCSQSSALSSTDRQICHLNQDALDGPQRPLTGPAPYGKSKCDAEYTMVDHSGKFLSDDVAHKIPGKLTHGYYASDATGHKNKSKRIRGRKTSLQKTVHPIKLFQT